MANIRFRLAKQCDVEEITNIHFAIRSSYPIGIFAQLVKLKYLRCFNNYYILTFNFLLNFC